MQSTYAEEFACYTSQFGKVSLTNVGWTILRNVATRLMTSGTRSGSSMIMVKVTAYLEVSHKMNCWAKVLIQKKGGSIYGEIFCSEITYLF